jgi:hypothetical protein
MWLESYRRAKAADARILGGLAEKTTDAYWLRRYGLGREPHEGFTLIDAQLKLWQDEEKKR